MNQILFNTKSNQWVNSSQTSNLVKVLKPLVSQSKQSLLKCAKQSREVPPDEATYFLTHSGALLTVSHKNEDNMKHVKLILQTVIVSENKQILNNVNFTLKLKEDI